MRDRRFVAIHRGGPLSLQRHRQLAAWAADCAERGLPMFRSEHPADQRPWQAIQAARAWSRGEISVGEARAASVQAHAAAREAANEAARYVARAAGHAVATAHMADHAPGAAVYVIKAIRAGADEQLREAAAAEEHRWQKEHLPEEVRELVLSTFEQKFSFMGL